MAAPITINLPDGEWTCRWVNDFCYSKDRFGNGISVSCVVSYVNARGDVKNIFSPLNVLYRTVIGNKLLVRNKTAHVIVSNPAQQRVLYQTAVTEECLSQTASCFFNHLGLTYEQHNQALVSSSPFQTLMRELQLPTGFGYTPVHCLPAPDGSSVIRNVIIPSYEVLRYFFLQGNTLPDLLLSYFTGRAQKGKRICQGIPELVAHPTGEPLVVVRNGERVAFLQVKEGLSKAEVSCLARIAFIPWAADCLDKVREGLLLSSARPDNLPDRWHAFKSLRTILPQSRPFMLAACGREFSWQGKSYLLVDQIYDTQEKMPFDKISYLPLGDHRSKSIPLNPAAARENLSPRTKTQPAASARLTADELGNTNQPTSLMDSVDTVSVFGEKPPVIKLPKRDQTGRYHTVGISQEESELLSLLEQGLKDAGPGRVRVEAGIPDTHSQVRNLFTALQVLPTYTCAYLNLDQDPPIFQERYYLNRTRPGLPHAVMLGRLQPRSGSTQATVYVVWASTIRYALFYTPTLQPLDSSVLNHLHTELFGKAGLDTNLMQQHLELWHRFNPADLRVEGLVSKIEGDLREIIDGRKSRTRVR
ncbi:hypothetical protein [Hymenobacter yonginensis]|uniref:Uncharacterized protein n=1 Tax=Hymenobacter yonginensis TaxID=748197 RepID=A0ABY7PNJ1_9BACT|nr:hypothetical protein [Hymenobacter yonginensis]WBO83610.1 hypothetical protein O9Z63_14635 [Hymenobacter yonginensis]